MSVTCRMQYAALVLLSLQAVTVVVTSHHSIHTQYKDATYITEASLREVVQDYGENSMPNPQKDFLSLKPYSIRISPINMIMQDVTQQDGRRFACTGVGMNHTFVPWDSNQPKRCTLQDVVSTEDAQRFIEVIVRPAFEYMQTLLRVRRVVTHLNLNIHGQCGTAEIPNDLSRVGLEADLAILVTGRPVNAFCSSAVNGASYAYSSTCALDQYGRPVLGHLNVDPRLFPRDGDDEKFVQYARNVVLHELGHMMAWDETLWSHFVDEALHQVPFHADVEMFKYELIQYRTTVDMSDPEEDVNAEKRQVYRAERWVDTKYVTAAARAHFQCDTLRGAELEDGVGKDSRTPGAHLEKRVFKGDIMNLEVTESSHYSPVSLALFEDSGWYRVNFDLAQDLQWGRGKGCAFATESCARWHDVGYECTEDGSNECAEGGLSRGRCSLTTYRHLDPWFQHFSQANVGGPDSLMDYCPLIEPFEDCTDGDANDTWAEMHFGAEHCTECRCFKSSLVHISIPTNRGLTTNCHKQRCVDNSLEVEIDGIWYPCPLGRLVRPESRLWKGGIQCPLVNPCTRTQLTCDAECGEGECVYGECRCPNGFNGDECNYPIRYDYHAFFAGDSHSSLMSLNSTLSLSIGVGYNGIMLIAIAGTAVVIMIWVAVYVRKKRAQNIADAVADNTVTEVAI
eukprot:GFYU01002045.1.p1 GENE.GFYU01002045.1~~GFYU01002045.1.p1  ORF type:complete len:680 (+),score=152.54 GFYU01002045.1:202-2241(+)